MAIDIKLSRSCEGSGNINDDVTQLLCILDKTTVSLFRTKSNQWVCNL